MRIRCLDDIVHALNDSGSPNVAQLVGSQNGEVIIAMFTWSEYFEEITVKTVLKGISQMHHFHFTSTAPGKVFVKDTDNNEQCINPLKSPIPSYHLAYLWKDSITFMIRSRNLYHMTYRI